MRYLSLFSGIEAATAAWGPLGWHCSGVAEIEPFPCNLLAAKYPEVPNLGSVTRVALCAKYGPERLLWIVARFPRSRLASAYYDLATTMLNMPDTDIMVFGSPCQDLSVAGNRKGLEGERSGLFYAAVLIGKWLRAAKHCRFWLWENVPGAFSSNDGRDFAVVVGAMAGLAAAPAVPAQGWGTEGAAVGEALLEWSTLDAQWFGVAQRRRRCFALADFGDWASRPPILLESESLRGDTAPRREAGQDIAGTLAACSFVGGAGGRPEGAAGNLFLPVITGALRASTGGPDLEHARAGQFVVVGDGAVATSDVTGTLCADGKSAGFNGQAARQGKLVVCISNAEGTEGLPFLTVSNLSKQFNNQMPLLAYGFSCKDDGGDATLGLAPTMRAMGHDKSHANGGGQLAVAFAFKASHYTRGKDGAPSPITPPLSADADRGDQDTLVLDARHLLSNDPVQTITCNESRTYTNEGAVFQLRNLVAQPPEGWEQWDGSFYSFRVRRLTPTECERLQGYEDGYTAIDGVADTPRYKALGNTMCVNVMRWIGRSIEFAILLY